MRPTLRDPGSREDGFAATRWTMILEAGDSATESQRAWDALSELCHIYWRPLYLFLRREGIGTEDAQDLTQDFLAELIHDRSYRRAKREKGRFRSFLLGALRHFVADARDRAQTQKRGGGKIRERFDEQTVAELEAQVQANIGSDASAFFDREWAAALLRETFDRLAEECALTGKSALFEGLRPYLIDATDEAVPYEKISQELHRGPGTLRSDLARLRTRYRTILREEVRGTVNEANEVDDELRYLCQVMAQT